LSFKSKSPSASVVYKRHSLADLITFLPEPHSREGLQWAARTTLRAAAAAGHDSLGVVDEVARFEEDANPTSQRVEAALAEVFGLLGYDGPAGP
jgi:hypothetical protein